MSVAASIEDVDEGAWSGLTESASLYLGGGFLRAVEADLSMSARYLLAQDADATLLGGLPVYLWDGRSEIVAYYDPYALFVAPIVPEPAPRDPWFPALLVGSRNGYLTELALRPDLDSSGRAATLRALLDGIRDLARELEVSTIAWLYLRRRALDELRPGLPAEALVLQSWAHTRLDVRWHTFEEYLLSFHWHRRGKLRKEIRQFEEAGCKVEIGRFGEWSDRIAPLLGNLQRRYGQDADDETMAAFLARRAAFLDDASIVFLCHLDGALVGFSLFHEAAGQLYAAGVGFDYERLGRLPAYFNLTYYVPIRHAIENGLGTIHYGPGSFEAKLYRGATLEPLWSVVQAPAAGSAWRALAAEWNDRTYAAWNERFRPLVGELPVEEWRDPP